jgi:two-component system response regulator NreC
MVQEMNQFEIIGSARNGKEGAQLVEALSPDLVLMDIDMPIMNGLEATRRIKALDNNSRIIILTMHNEVSLIKKVMEIGADGYLLKNADRNEFCDALNTVSNGKPYFSVEVTQSLLHPEVCSKSNFDVDPDSIQLSKLTEREIEVLKYIAEGFSNKEIGEQLFISHRTVDTHRTNLMKKLEAHNIAGLIKFAIKNGMVS